MTLRKFRDLYSSHDRSRWNGPTLRKKGGKRGAGQLPWARLQLAAPSLILAVNGSLIRGQKEAPPRSGVEFVDREIP